ncbi:MAG: hypothetical protein M1817_006011 [Caeruleum heppii]|nr:MAG: hypothetical protein M1817_006011 [Caeruleum heppii]
MLDENLPTFHIRPSHDSTPNRSTLFLSQHGSDLEPAYTLRRPDPSLATSKNCYAIALFDSFNPDILYAEVLVKPEWTTPTLSAAEIKRGETVPPPPIPIIPNDFVIQLYAPDQQVAVKQKPSSWGGTGSWEFELPQQTFRQPSGSSLDRGQDDPAASELTPKLRFRWKKDGKLSKDLVCSLAGKSTNPDGSKKKGGGSREPDITVALFKHLKDVTIYEPNLSRVEVEDPKGLEVVILLSAAAIRDMFFSNLREVFQITSPPKRNGSLDNGRKSTSPPTVAAVPVPSTSALPVRQKQSTDPSISGPPPPTTNGNHLPSSSSSSSQPPPADGLTQWAIDAETARLAAESRRVAERQAVERAERARVEEKEQRRITKMLVREEKRKAEEERRRKEDVERETERLRRVYGRQDAEADRLRRQQQQQQRPGGGGGGGGGGGLTPNIMGPVRPSSVPPPLPPHNQYRPPHQGHRPAAASSSYHLPGGAASGWSRPAPPPHPQYPTPYARPAPPSMPTIHYPPPQHQYPPQQYPQPHSRPHHHSHGHTHSSNTHHKPSASGSTLDLLAPLAHSLGFGSGHHGGGGGGGRRRSDGGDGRGMARKKSSLF